MPKYKKFPKPARPVQAMANRPPPMLGLLYLVDVRLFRRTTQEKVKHRLLLIGCEEADIERKLRWIFDSTVYEEFSVTGIEKVREKIHYLSTVITSDEPAPTKIIDRNDHQDHIGQNRTLAEAYDPNLYAIGLSTTMLAKDELHAVRKVANALIASATHGDSHTGARLSDDSTLTVERIPKGSAYARPRDVSQEVNKAHIMRG